ncbi:hypothetical protein BS78_02G045600 [Paspalum vaginatum]|nr:hypothetical protein BS78_02G045600 [Paspalum vaginatum]
MRGTEEPPPPPPLHKQIAPARVSPHIGRRPPGLSGIAKHAGNADRFDNRRILRWLTSPPVPLRSQRGRGLADAKQNTEIPQISSPLSRNEERGDARATARATAGGADPIRARRADPAAESTGRPDSARAPRARPRRTSSGRRPDRRRPRRGGSDLGLPSKRRRRGKRGADASGGTNLWARRHATFPRGGKFFFFFFGARRGEERWAKKKRRRGRRRRRRPAYFGAAYKGRRFPNSPVGLAAVYVNTPGLDEMRLV